MAEGIVHGDVREQEHPVGGHALPVDLAQQPDRQGVVQIVEEAAGDDEVVRAEVGGLRDDVEGGALDADAAVAERGQARQRHVERRAVGVVEDDGAAEVVGAVDEGREVAGAAAGDGEDLGGGVSRDQAIEEHRLIRHLVAVLLRGGAPEGVLLEGVAEVSSGVRLMPSSR